MKEYLCGTTADGYEKGKVYRLDESNERTRLLIRLGYLEDVTKEIKEIKGGRKK